MVSQKRLKGHGSKKEEKTNKTAGIVILVIMVFSVAGFAMLSGGGFGDSSSNPNSQSSDIALQEGVYQNPQTGETYWGARKNGEEFIFFNGIEGFEQNLEVKTISDNLKNSEIVELYVDNGFQSSDAVYGVEKSLYANDITYFRVDNLTQCSTSVLVLTNGNNESTSPDLLSGCSVFVLPEGEESIAVDVLLFHMIK